MYSEAEYDALSYMAEYIADIESFIAEKTADKFLADKLVSRAVLQSLEVISEASRRLSKELKGRHPSIPWRQIASAGNAYRHEYDGIDWMLVWDTACDLGGLLRAIRAELASYNSAPDLIIRLACAEDAVESVRTLRRSISELCFADHGNDPAILAEWLAKKNTNQFLSWLSDKDGRLFVAERAGKILGVASIRTLGEIVLNYISPDARFLGISKRLMNAMEAEAMKLGIRECTLTSTETAHRFYLDLGYRDEKQSISKMTGHAVYEMRKSLL
jgi:uncharacterized protein with HEPN domain/N-acetylglutamate synthase-like GNAT family acetyltransferase